MPQDERVLCFKRELLEAAGVFQGISLEVERYMGLVTRARNLVTLPRSEAEHDPRFKQLIPYVILVSGERILRYRRGVGGGEKRLHGLWSVGIGGHISEEDRDLFSSDDAGYYDGMWREVKEEVDLEPLREAAVAVINDDSTDVGAVHFGVVHIVHVAGESIAGRRWGILAPEFVPVRTARADTSGYESWSSLCLQHIDALLAKAEAEATPAHPL